MNKRETACAYLDTGSEQLLYQKTFGTGVIWHTFIDLEFFGNKHKDVEVFYNEVAGDMLIGQNILDKYSVTFQTNLTT